MSPGVPARVRSDSRVSHPPAGFLPSVPSGLVSCPWRSWGCPLQSFFLRRSRSVSRRPPPSCRRLAAPVDRAAVTGPIAGACALMSSAYPASRSAAKDPRGPTSGPVTSPESVSDRRRVNRSGRSLLSWGSVLSRALHRTTPGSCHSKASGLSPLGVHLLLPWPWSRRSCHLPRERRPHLRAGPSESCSAWRGHTDSRPRVGPHEVLKPRLATRRFEASAGPGSSFRLGTRRASPRNRQFLFGPAWPLPEPLER